MSLETLKQRLNYRGGNAQGRLERDKLRSLKSVLKNGSYQTTDILLLNKENDEYDRAFKCLINPDKTKEDYRNMILSIPYEDIQLNAAIVGKTSEGQALTEIAPGQVFYWPEMETYWIIYLHHIEERAYFRAEIRQCEKEVVIGGKTYKIYFRGPTETTIQWGQKSDTVWNNLNYSAVIYITKDENTTEYIKRFAKLVIDGETWQVAARNNVSGDGIIEVALEETYTDTFPDPIPVEPEDNILIKGDNLVYPYDIKVYTIDIEEPAGTWLISNKKAVIREQDATAVTVEIVTGKSGEFDLIYRQEGQNDIIQPIVIQSL